MSAPRTLRVTAMTHRGALRDGNEDSLVIGAFTVCAADQDDPVVVETSLSTPVLVAVADGMGGHAAGEVASAHTVRTLATTVPRDAAAVEAALRRVDTELLAMGEADPGLHGMGTTVAGALVTSEGWLRFGVGDSRVYRQHGGYLAQVSVDDSGPTGGLTQSLGGRGTGTELRIDTEQMPAAGRLLLCSDGLSDLVELEAMEALLAAPGGSVRVVKSLWAAAMNESGRDNITVALVELVGDPPPAPRAERATAGQGAPT